MNLVQFRRELDRVRQKGYSVDDEEVTLGARCVGAPILGKNQEAVAAISISGPVTRIGREQLPSLGAAVIEASSRISASMGLTQTSAENNPRAKRMPYVASGRL
jgi:IclR family transcriptional regulator, acetate operon repressor